MINVPNAITLLRFVLVPVIGLQLLHREYGVAFAPFILFSSVESSQRCANVDSVRI